jgi:hypothetical protein
LTVGGFGDFAVGVVLDLPSRIGELLDGELGLRKVLKASTAPDLCRKRDAFEPVWKSVRVLDCPSDRVG